MAIPIRNVLIVGPVGTGKRSVGNHLFGKIEFDERKTFPALPKNIICKREYSADGKVSYNVIIADIAPALVNGRLLLKNAKGWFHSTATALNMVLFTYNQSTFNSEDEQALSFFISNLQMEISDISALIITGCEKLKDGAKSELEKRKDISRSTSQFMKKGTFTVGIPTSNPERVLSPQDGKVLRGLALDCAVQRTHREIFKSRPSMKTARVVEDTPETETCCTVL